MRLTFMMIVLLHGYFGRNHSVCSEYEGSKSKHKFYTAQRTEAKFSDKVATEPMNISLKTLYNITILKGKKYQSRMLSIQKLDYVFVEYKVIYDQKIIFKDKVDWPKIKVSYSILIVKYSSIIRYIRCNIYLLSGYFFKW